jgi:hypothetical protein
MIQRTSILCTAAALTLAVGLPAAAQPRNAISIELTPRMQDGKVAHVDVREVIAAPGLAAGQPLLKMPIVQTMAPTSLNDPASLKASDDAGPLPLEIKDDPVDPTQFKQDRTFVAKRATVGDVKIEYPATPRVVTAQTRPGPLWDMRTEGSGFYGQGGMILALPEGGWPRPVKLRWNLTEMPKGSRGATSTTEGPIDAILPREALTRSFLMAGPFHSSPPDGKGAFVAYWLTDPVFDMEAAVGWTRKAYAYFETFWNQPNKPFRVFMRTTERFQGGGGGGYQSFIFGNTAGQDRDQQDLRELMAHEASHNFVGNLGNSQGQWYSEGANVYYTNVLIHRAGLTSVARFGEAMNDLAKLYYLNPRSNMSNAEATKAFFSDGDAQVVPYQRGPLYFAMVDARVRAASGGKRRVDDLVKTALTQKGEGKKDVDVWTAVVRQGLGQAGVDEFNATPTARRSRAALANLARPGERDPDGPSWGWPPTNWATGSSAWAWAAPAGRTWPAPATRPCWPSTTARGRCWRSGAAARGRASRGPRTPWPGWTPPPRPSPNACCAPALRPPATARAYEAAVAEVVERIRSAARSSRPISPGAWTGRLAAGAHPVRPVRRLRPTVPRRSRPICACRAGPWCPTRRSGS